MIALITIFILAIASSLLVYFITGLSNNIANCWMPTVFFFGFFIAWFVLYALALWLMTRFVDKKKEVKKPSKLFHHLLRQAADYVVFFSNVKVHVLHKELMPKNDKNNKFMIVSNHVSNFDHLSIMVGFRRYQLASISKPELEAVPVIGRTQHAAGFIPINRENPLKAMKAVLQAADFIKKGYTSIVVAPEGTRHKDGEIAPFHPLTFKIPYKAECLLVVMSIRNTNLVRANFPFKRTHVYIDVIKVFNKEDYEKISANELAEICHDLIKDNLDK